MPKPFLIAGVVFAIFIISLNALFVVKETEQAMVLTLGKVDRLVPEPGLNLKSLFYSRYLCLINGCWKPILRLRKYRR